MPADYVNDPASPSPSMPYVSEEKGEGPTECDEEKSNTGIIIPVVLVMGIIIIMVAIAARAGRKKGPEEEDEMEENEVKESMEDLEY